MRIHKTFEDEVVKEFILKWRTIKKRGTNISNEYTDIFAVYIIFENLSQIASR